MPGWTRHAIFYHLYPLGFLGAESRCEPAAAVQHRLPRLGDWLDYVVRLGANGLLLGPVFRSSTHGYDTVDYRSVDPRLGDEDDLRALVDACRARGVRVVLDGVFHHVGRDHPAFQDVLARREASPYASWFHVRFDPSAPDGVDYDTFEGHRQLVRLNHDDPAVLDEVTAVCRYWLDRGVDGFRLDAAYAVPRSFWRALTGRLRESHPDAFLFGEVLHGDYAGFVAETGVDTVTQYELWKAMWSAVHDRNFYELSWTLQRHGELLPQFRPLTFAGNHDVTRLATAVGDDRHVAHVLAVLFTVPGTPCVYAGDELGLHGVKEHREGGDEAVRPAFPARPEELGEDGWPVYRLHQELIALRRRQAWLADGRVVVGQVTNPALSYAVEGPDAAVAVALNIGDEPAALTLPLDPAAWQPPAWQAGADAVAEATGEGYRYAAVPPHGWTIGVASRR